MKHTFLFTALIAGLLFANQSNAQLGKVTKLVPKVTVGIKVGANFQQISGSNTGFTTLDNAYKGGIVGGAFVGVTKKRIGVQVEGLVKSAQIDYTTTLGTGNPVKLTINTVSLDIPVLFEYKLFWRLWFQVGPQFSTILSAKESSTDVKNNFNTTNFDGVVGLQANLPMHFTIAARYILGVTNINKESVSMINTAWNDRSIQLSLGFRFL